MADYLNVSQMKKLQEILLKNLSENELQRKEIENEEYLRMFIEDILFANTLGDKVKRPHKILRLLGFW